MQKNKPISGLLTKCLLRQLTVGFGADTVDFYPIGKASHNGIGAFIFRFHHPLEIDIVAAFVMGVISFVIMAIHVRRYLRVSGKQVDHLLGIPEVMTVPRGTRWIVAKYDHLLPL